MATTDLPGPQLAVVAPIPKRRRRGLGSVFKGSVAPRAILIAGCVPVHHPVLLDGRQRAQVEP